MEAARFPEHRLRFRNQRAAARVGLAELTDAEWIDHFGRFRALPANLPEPLALRYHGHQFQSYNPDLGDGRGFLFAQLLDCVDGRLLDLGTKGSGQTPCSRMGDGRLTLKGGIREVLATELLEALGVYTSWSFSLSGTHAPVFVTALRPFPPARDRVIVRLSRGTVDLLPGREAVSLGPVDFQVARFDLVDLRPAGVASSTRCRADCLAVVDP